MDLAQLPKMNSVESCSTQVPQQETLDHVLVPSPKNSTKEKKKNTKGKVMDMTLCQHSRQYKLRKTIDTIMYLFIKEVDGLAKRTQQNLPSPEEVDEDISREALVQELGDNIDLRNDGSHQNNRHIRGVEQLDRVWLPTTRSRTTQKPKSQMQNPDSTIITDSSPKRKRKKKR